MKDEKIKLTEILEIVEFDYIINDDRTISLIDNLAVNLGNIESETFKINENLALAIIDRLSIYIEDYITDGYAEILRTKCNEQANKSDTYLDLLEKMKKYPDVFPEYCLKILAALDNPNELIDVSDILQNARV